MSYLKGILRINRKWVHIMEQSERRDELKRLLFIRRVDTISNLAKELNVSARTVRRDLDALCLSEAIYTVPGRYGGGVYVLDTFNPNFKQFNEKEIEVLKKIICYLEIAKEYEFSEDEIRTLKNLLKTYTKNI